MDRSVCTGDVAVVSATVLTREADVIEAHVQCTTSTARTLARPVVTKCSGCRARHAGICGAVGDDDLERLAAAATAIRVEPGRRFITEGDIAADVFTLTGGTVRLLKTLSDGRQQITSFAGPGDFLGLAVGARYAYSAEAVGSVRACRFARPRLRALIAAFPELEARLLEIISNELVLAQEQMLLLGRKTARERVASFLIARSGGERRGATPVPLPMSRGDIADYLGLRIETVSRAVTQLKAARLIAVAPDAAIFISDYAALKALAAGH
jgi:CRP/FNR family transcriptional regulator